jgi:hypothetical protein
VAEIPVSIMVRDNPVMKDAASIRTNAQVYRKIFASYSHKDEKIVEEFEKYSRATGDNYLRDVSILRTGELWNERISELIKEADVFQLFWSNNSMNSTYVRQEWEYALALGRPYFIRPVFWEDPLPEDKEKKLPPEDLRKYHFHKLPSGKIIYHSRKMQNASEDLVTDPHDEFLTTQTFLIKPDVMKSDSEQRGEFQKNQNVYAQPDFRESIEPGKPDKPPKKGDLEYKVSCSPPKDSSIHLQIPAEMKNRYLDLQIIGHGGFGRVYRGKRRKDGYDVAVKILNTSDPKMVKDVFSDLKRWVKLDHKNVVKLIDFNVIPTFFTETELCDRTLADLEKSLSTREAVQIMFEVCEGLKYLHARGIIHRDLKPRNILIKNNVPKISDLDPYRPDLDRYLSPVGIYTPFYAAPEQISSNSIDIRTDIWQVGVILFELIHGTLPFTGDSLAILLKNINSEKPSLPEADAPDKRIVNDIITKCLEKDPEHRYQSVTGLQKDLGGYLISVYRDDLKHAKGFEDIQRISSELMLISMKIGDNVSAYNYLMDLAQSSQGIKQQSAFDLADAIRMRIDAGIHELPDELILNAELLTGL